MRTSIFLTLFFLTENVMANFPTQIGETVFYTDLRKRTWDECHAAALSFNLSFASVHSKEENDSIDTQYWLGGKRDCEKCSFYWVDGTEWDYENWSPNEPKSGSHLAKFRFESFWRTYDLLFPNGKAREYFCLFRAEKPMDVGEGRITTTGDDIVVEHPIGPYVTQTVQVGLYDFGCITEIRQDENSTVTLNNAMGDSRPFTYEIKVEEDNIIIDQQNVVNSTGNASAVFSSIKIKFCTRVTTFKNSVAAKTRDTNFILSYDLMEGLNLTSIDTENIAGDVFETISEDEFSVQACQCNDFECVSPYALAQSENFIMCIFPIDNLEPIFISNFNVKMSAGRGTNYYEYNPIWFGAGQWEHDELTAVEEEENGDTIMITTKIVSQFFYRGFDSLDLNGDVLIDSDSSKGKAATKVKPFSYQQSLIVVQTATNCFTSLIKKILIQSF